MHDGSRSSIVVCAAVVQGLTLQVGPKQNYTLEQPSQNCTCTEFAVGDRRGHLAVSGVWDATTLLDSPIVFEP